MKYKVKYMITIEQPVEFEIDGVDINSARVNASAKIEKEFKDSFDENVCNYSSEFINAVSI